MPRINGVLEIAQPTECIRNCEQQLEDGLAKHDESEATNWEQGLDDMQAELLKDLRNSEGDS